MQQIGPPWYNPSQRRPLLHGHPNRHMCRQWFYVPSGQRPPVVTAGYIIITSLLRSQSKIWPSATYLWSPDNKTPTGLQVVNGVIIQIDAGDHSFDNLLFQGLSHLLQADVLVMLDRDDNCVHAHWQHGAAVLAVLDSDLRAEYMCIYKNTAAYFTWLAIWWPVWWIYLRLRVRPEPWKSAVPTQLGHLGIQLVCKDNSERHAFLCLIGCISKHQTLQWKKSYIIYPQDGQIKTNLNKPTTDLVPCSNILFIAINMNTLSNIRRLLLQGHKNIAGLVVKTYKKKQLKSPFSNVAKLKMSLYARIHTFAGVIVSNLTDSFADYFLIVHGCVWCHLSGQKDHPSFGNSLWTGEKRRI